MTETADTNDADLLARTATKSFQRSEHCDSCAKQRRSGRGIEVIRELDGEFALDASVIGVAALGDRGFAVGELYSSLVRPGHAFSALRLESALAEVALVAAESLSADADTVADLVSRVGASANDGTDDLVTDTVCERSSQYLHVKL